MKSLLELQNSSGQLWLEIKEHLDAKDSEIAALKAERDDASGTVAALVAKVEAHKDDPAKLVDEVAKATKSRRDKELAELIAQREEIQKKIDARKAVTGKSK